MSFRYVQSKEYYKEVIKDFLDEHNPPFLEQLIRDNELEEILDYRAERFLKQMDSSSNPQDEKEIYYQEMLDFPLPQDEEELEAEREWRKINKELREQDELRELDGLED